MPAIQAEVARLVTPEAVESVGQGSAKRLDLEQRRVRILDMYDAGDIDRDEYRRRIEAVDRAVERLDAQRVVSVIPRLDWTWPPRQINAVLRAMFERIELDAATFQPTMFHWTVPEWRSETPAYSEAAQEP